MLPIDGQISFMGTAPGTHGCPPSTTRVQIVEDLCHFCAARPFQSLGSQCFELSIKWVDIPCKLVKSSASKWVKSDITMVLRIGAGECVSVTKPRLHLELAVPWLLSTFGFLFSLIVVIMMMTKLKVPSTLFSHPVLFALFVL